LNDTGEYAVKPFGIYTNVLGLRKLINHFGASSQVKKIAKANGD